MSNPKITLQHDAENYQFQFKQEGMPGLTINEGYLQLFVEVLENSEFHEIYYYGSFRVHREGKSTIITSFNKKTPGWLPILVFDAEQLKKLKTALNTNFSFVLDAYSKIKG